MVKTCPCCGYTLPIGRFGFDRSRTDGRNVYCRECIRRRDNPNNLTTRVYLISHTGKRIRSAFSHHIRMKLDRFERQHHEVYVDCEDKVWRWGNFRRPAFESMAEWMARVAERGLSVEWL